MFYLVKIKGSLWKYHILMLIHANQFYNLELIEFKAYTAPTCISIPLNNLGWFFEKISITYNLGQNCWDKIENLFFREKTRLLPNQCCSRCFRFLTTKLDSTLIQRGKGESLEFEKLSHFLNLLVSTSFVQGCRYIALHRHDPYPPFLTSWWP